jgi:hypothetical protein
MSCHHARLGAADITDYPTAAERGTWSDTEEDVGLLVLKLLILIATQVTNGEESSRLLNVA